MFDVLCDGNKQDTGRSVKNNQKGNDSETAVPRRPMTVSEIATLKFAEKRQIVASLARDIHPVTHLRSPRLRKRRTDSNRARPRS
jgi:hypothetical protein